MLVRDRFGHQQDLSGYIGQCIPNWPISISIKEIAPRVTRAAIIRDPTVPVGIGQLGAIQSVAPSFGVEANPIDVRDAS